MPSTLTRDQIIALVLGRLGRQETNAYLVASAKSELALIQTRLEGGAFMPWFLLSGEITTLSTQANVRTVDLPANFLREYEDFPTYRYVTGAAQPYVRMNKDEFDILESKYGEDSPGTPLEYALVGSQFHLFPTPNAIFPLRTEYFQTDTALSDSVATNLWTANASDLLVAELGYIMAGYRRDKPMQDTFMADISRAMGRLITFDEARKQAVREAFRGDRS